MLAPLMAAMLAGCGPQSPEDIRAAAIAKCEIRFARAVSDPAKGTAWCTCTTDRLAENGLALTDMLGSERAKVEGITQSCARSAGISLPTP
ncbi:hypothetical protein [Porphyrobacter sp. AAP60]|uniref:hypothetical protein n=1 Tax=Porphyrobacter sp. AAP60 TaxID=1523423 RepID=UPI0012E17328|nr:hypothetical protein [Porphyrobacter sp. AAP60]